MPLDRSGQEPLWAQLEYELRKRVNSGEFDDGNFPTDAALTRAYGVSRHTVREAIRGLNRDGLLSRQRGRGTFIRHTEFEQSLGTLYSLFHSVESSGVKQTSKTLDLKVVNDPVASAHLNLTADSMLVYLCRLRFAGDEPLAVDRAWLDLELTEPLLNVDWTHTALYAELATIGAPVPTHGWERLTPILASSRDRQLLKLDNETAAFFLERLGANEDKPIEWRTTTIRGDRFRFVADWSKGSHTALRPLPR